MKTSGKTKTKFAKVTAVIVINCLVAFVLLEIGFRTYYSYVPNIGFLRFASITVRRSLVENPEEVMEVQEKWQRLYDDPLLGWTHVPGSNIQRGDFRSKVNEMGFNTPDTPSIEEEQILITGDSFLEGTRMSNPLAWEFKKLVRKPLFNMAVAGWGPGSYLAAFNKYGCKRKSDFVLVFSFINDIQDVKKFEDWKTCCSDKSYKHFMLYRRWYTFSINKGTTLLDRHSVFYNVLKYALWMNFGIDVSDSPKEVSGSEAESFQKRVEHMERVFDDYNNLKFIPETLRGEGGQKTEIKLNFNKNRMFILCNERDLDEEGVCFSMFKDYFSAMDKLNSAITSCGKSMILVWIPNKERIYFEQLAPDRQRYYLPKKAQIHGAEKVVEWYANDRAIPLIDLTAPLLKEASIRVKAGEIMYEVKGGHFNNIGCKYVAKVVYDALIERDFLTP